MHMIELKVSLMRRGLAKQKYLQKSFKVSKFNVRLPYSEAGRLFQILVPATEKLLSPSPVFVLETVRTLA